MAPEAAEKLLVHREDPVCMPVPTGARVMGAVVIAIEIGHEGQVFHPRIISGPAMLRQPALEAVRKYRHTPYRLDRKPALVETTVSIRFTCD